jgi:hypothetical protein
MPLVSQLPSGYGTSKACGRSGPFFTENGVYVLLFNSASPYTVTMFKANTLSGPWTRITSGTAYTNYVNSTYNYAWSTFDGTDVYVSSVYQDGNWNKIKYCQFSTASDSWVTETISPVLSNGVSCRETICPIVRRSNGSFAWIYSDAQSYRRLWHVTGDGNYYNWVWENSFPTTVGRKASVYAESVQVGLDDRVHVCYSYSDTAGMRSKSINSSNVIDGTEGVISTYYQTTAEWRKGLNAAEQWKFVVGQWNPYTSPSSGYALHALMATNPSWTSTQVATNIQSASYNTLPVFIEGDNIRVFYRKYGTTEYYTSITPFTAEELVDFPSTGSIVQQPTLGEYAIVSSLNVYAWPTPVAAGGFIWDF